MEKIDYNDVLLVTGILGDKHTIIYDAPSPSHNCYFFTNNKKEKDNIINKGWNYEYLDIELSEDEITCSLQAKYIKFLKFIDDYDGKFKKFKQILYFDHKFNIKKEDVENILNISYKNENKYNVITRYHEEPKKLWKEIEDSKYQYKYMKNIDKVINLVNSKVEDGSLKDADNVQIAMTGLLFYNNYDEITPLLNEIYDVGNELQQPQCQVLWSIFSQKYQDKILVVNHNEMNPELLWVYPPYTWIDTSNMQVENFTSGLLSPSTFDGASHDDITPRNWVYFFFIILCVPILLFLFYRMIQYIISKKYRNISVFLQKKNVKV